MRDFACIRCACTKVCFRDSELRAASLDASLTLITCTFTLASGS